MLHSFATVALKQLEQPGLANLVTLLWLLICVYTWVGPWLFRRSLQKDLQKVVLRPGF